jgi:hypothetical protein
LDWHPQDGTFMKSLAAICLFSLVVGIVSARAARAEKATTYQVPFRLTETKHILIRAKINGKGPFNFIMDTGAPMLIVATSVGKQLGLSEDADGWAALKRFELEGGLTVTNVKARVETPFQLEGMNGLGLVGVPLHGMIGYNVLAKFRIEIDVTRNKMGWTPLDFEPGVPQRIDGRGGAPGGLDALGSILKLLGAILGKKSDAPITLQGSLGLELSDSDGSVEVRAVQSQGPAARAGLKPGDRLTRVQDKEVKTAGQVRQVTAGLKAGEIAKVEGKRGSEPFSLEIKLGEGF